VRVFASGSALLESGCVAKIDGLISDIGMPGINGFDLLQEMRAARPQLPIILITGHTAMLNLAPLIGVGYHRLFEKPFDGDELLAALGDALRSARVRKPQS